MGWYCIVNKLKDESVDDYRKAHINMYKSEYKNQLKVLRDADAEECLVYLWNGYSILFYKCRDIDSSFKKLGQSTERKPWDELTLPWFDGDTKFDGSDKVQSCEMIFDLRNQLKNIGE